MAEASRYLEMTPSAADLQMTPREVARLAKAGPLSGCADAVDAAIAEARTLVAPRARWTRIDTAELARLFAAESPVLPVAQRGACWAFVATIGPALDGRVAEHFDASHFLEGVLLDAAGSVAAEAVADAIETACTGERRSERFSPGYCAWVMESQPRLFDLLKPLEIGIALLPSFLMQPLKSISGIVVQASDLRVAPEACEQCNARGCTRRQAAYRVA